MKKSHLLGALCAVVLALIATASQATLVGVLPATPGGTDYQAYYDTVADLTWLADANAGGLMTWNNADAWTAGLNINGVARWRLPYTPDIDPTCDQTEGPGFYGCSGSEMGNLFYNVLGGVAHQSIATTHNDNYALFSNIQPGYYWSTDAAWNAPYSVWSFGMGDGEVDAEAEKELEGSDPYNPYYSYTWPVHSGNAGAVPLPAAVWLFGSGLLGLIGIARRKNTA